MPLWRQFLEEEFFSVLGPICCHPISIPTLNSHYAYLKFMKLLGLGDEGIVRMEFLSRYHLLQIRKLAVLVVTNLRFTQYRFLKMPTASQ